MLLIRDRILGAYLVVFVEILTLFFFDRFLYKEVILISIDFTTRRVHIHS